MHIFFIVLPGVDVEIHVFESIKLIFEKMMNIKIEAKNIKEFQYIDFKLVEPSEENLIKKEFVNNAINSLYESSLSKNGIKILYIKNVDQGNKFSLNSLLKFIEEPVNNLIVFMSTNNIDKVISTIKSRTQNIFVKPMNIDQKIKIFENYCSEDKLMLISTLFNSVDDFKQIDQTVFNQTYDAILLMLEKAVSNPFYVKTMLNEIWTKNNTEFILDILQSFFYQVQISNKKYSLFPLHESLIMKYKTKNIDYFEIQKMIEKSRNNYKIHANFVLQKAIFLAELEKFFKIIS